MEEAQGILRMVEEGEFGIMAVQTRAVRKLQESLFQKEGNEFQLYLDALTDLDN